MSHTKLDKKFCDDFDRVVARVGIPEGVFRSEFEDLVAPPWKTIFLEMNASKAMFLLVGSELVASQGKAELFSAEAESWKFTQNWISYEVGLACQLGIDVWVICDNVKINFPVPYFTNYEIYGIGSEKSASFDFYRGILQSYKDGMDFRLGAWKGSRLVNCPHKNCRAAFNLFSDVLEGGRITCPSCLREMEFAAGFHGNT